MVLDGELLIPDSKLTNNKAASGGAIGLFRVNASILSCNITNNEASGETSLGRAISRTIYLSPKSCLKTTVLILVECFLFLMYL